MARSMIITFPKASATALYALSVAGGGAGLIPLAIPYPVVFPNISRPITLTSTDNLSGVNFTIVGTDLNGLATTEVLAGPNNATVHSVNAYNTIISITANGAYTNFSAGTYTTGFIQWVPMNYQIGTVSITIQAVVTNTINYSLYDTLDPMGYYVTRALNDNYVPLTNPTQNAIVAALTGATTTQFYNYTPPVVAIGGIINSSSGNGALTLTILQAGV